MIGKPWGQLSTEEKIEILRQQIADLFGQAHINVLIANQALNSLSEKVDSLEKRLDQVDKGVTVRQQDGT